MCGFEQPNGPLPLFWCDFLFIYLGSFGWGLPKIHISIAMFVSYFLVFLFFGRTFHIYANSFSLMNPLFAPINILLGTDSISHIGLGWFAVMKLLPLSCLSLDVSSNSLVVTFDDISTLLELGMQYPSIFHPDTTWSSTSTSSLPVQYRLHVLLLTSAVKSIMNIKRPPDTRPDNLKEQREKRDPLN
ncbi:hypothetical protein V8F20_006518 [Naviculisporaceae sp. PSN 640]